MNLNSPVFKFISSLLGLLAVIVTIMSGWEQIKNKDPELHIFTVEKDKITAIKNIPGLSATFLFNEVPINNLWRMKIRIRNKGNDVVIGKGTRSDLIEDSFDLTFPDGYKILNIKKSKDQVSSRVDRANDRAFSIFFEQWRPNEYIELDFVLEQDKGASKEPRVIPLSRSLIKGNTTITDYNILEAYEEKPLINMPFTMVFMADVFVEMMNCILFILFTYGFLNFLISYVKYYSWERENQAQFNEFINSLQNNSYDPEHVDIIMSYKSNPRNAPDWIWQKFQGDRVSGYKIFDSNRSNITFIIFSFLFIIAVIILLLGR